jgi:hypothetical protein
VGNFPCCPFLRTGIVISLVPLLNPLHAQLRISEVCTSNHTVLENTVGDHPDWVELHNAGTDPVDLTGYTLSNYHSDPAPWHLPQESLAPGEFIVFMAGNSDQHPHWFGFDLGRSGETLFLRDPSGALVNMLEVPALHPDNSFGVAPDGALRYFGTPTPGAANTTEAYLGYAPTPVFSRSAGSAAAGTEVHITAGSGTTIHISTNGRDPDTSSTVYGWPVTLHHTLVLKAIAVGPGLLPSAVSSATYLVNEPTTLPIVSLSTHPDTLFHPELGLYMVGPNADPNYPHWGANFWSERHVPVRFEYFDEHRVRRVDQVVDLKIHGGRVSRNQPQRPLRLTARKRHGADLIEYPFFPEKPWLQRFKRLVLRNSGADFLNGQIRDQLFHQVALRNGLDIDVLGYRPVVVFINGEYWGLMEMRERIDEDHLAFNHGVDPDSVLIMEEENFPIQGDSIHFHELQHYIRTHDMDDPVHYAHVDSLLDIHSLIDYFALEMFAGNVDWTSNNLKYWKPSLGTGKWRYLMYDLDATMHLYDWIPIDLDAFYWVLVHRAGFIHSEIFRSLLGNTRFRRDFLNRLADLMNTCLSEEGFAHEIARMRQLTDAEMPRHFSRWWGDIGTWEQHQAIIAEFAAIRPNTMREDVIQTFGLPRTVALTFEVFPPAAGRLVVNSLKPATPFHGIYFNGNAIDVAVEPTPGYRFSHWNWSGAPDMRWTEPVIQEDFTTDGTLTAHFFGPDGGLSVHPNPFRDELTLNVPSDKAQEVRITMHDPLGRTVLDITRPLTEGANAVRLPFVTGPTGLYVVSAWTDTGRLSTRVVRSIEATH